MSHAAKFHLLFAAGRGGGEDLDDSEEYDSSSESEHGATTESMGDPPHNQTKPDFSLLSILNIGGTGSIEAAGKEAGNDQTAPKVVKDAFEGVVGEVEGEEKWEPARKPSRTTRGVKPKQEPHVATKKTKKSGGGKKKPGGKLTPEGGAHEGHRIDVVARLKEFQQSDEQEYSFPAGLTAEQRAFIHSECKKYGFKSKSHGKGDKRFLKLSKPTAQTSMDAAAVVLGLKPASVDLLKDLLRAHPPTERELFGPTGLAANVPLEQGRRRQGKGKGKGNGGGGDRAETWDSGKCARELEELLRRRSAAGQREIQRVRRGLPISSRRSEILDLVRSNQVVLLAGETGCGKTTQVPQMLAESCWEEGRACKIVVTQPRRISAISVAERIASERGEKVGQSVGYSIRLEKKGTASSSIVMCTNGVLLRQLVQGGSLAGAGGAGSGSITEGLTHLVVDEIHERDRFADFLLIILREVLPRNPKVKVVLMSATLQVDLFSSYFLGCPTIRVDGFMYPVEQFYLEDVLGLLGRKARAGSRAKAGPAASAELERAMMLAFMHGTDEHFRELLAESSDPLQVNAVHHTTGATALMVAAAKGRKEDCLELLARGADPSLASAGGKGKAKDWACRAGHHDLAEFLIAQEEVSRRKGNERGEVSAVLADYQRSVNPDEVDLDIIVDLISFLQRDGRFDVESEENTNGTVEKGAVLVFLPGWDEISRLKDFLEREFTPDELTVLPLHSMVPVSEQRRVFQRPKRGTRKVVLATNIAETAITIDDIVFVVNSGRHKEKSYDPFSGVSTLLCSWTSRASERQRKGRAGRCQPGVCFHIYSQGRSNSLEEFQVPELKRTPLEEVCLQIKVMESNGSLPIQGGVAAEHDGSTVRAFLSRAIEPPAPQATKQALEILRTIGALADGERLTVLGKHLAGLPLPPQLGKLLLYGEIFSCLDSVLTSACFSAYRSPWVVPVDSHKRSKADKARGAFGLGAEGSDHLAMVRAFDQWRDCKRGVGGGSPWRFCDQNFLSPGTMNMVDGMRMQILSGLRDAKVAGNLRESSMHCSAGVVRAVLGCGYYPQIGYLKRMLRELQRNSKNKMRPSLMTKRGETVRIHPQSLASKRDTSKDAEEEADPMFVFEELTRNESQLYVKAVTEIPAIALCMVAADFRLEPQEPGEDGSLKTHVVLDDWIRYEVSQNHVVPLRVLRQRLGQAFTGLIERPWEEQEARLVDSVAALRMVFEIEAGGAPNRASFSFAAPGGGAAPGGRGRGGVRRGGGRGRGRERGRGRGRGRGRERGRGRGQSQASHSVPLLPKGLT